MLFEINLYTHLPEQPHEDIWMNVAQTLADMMQIIIEFAKLVPGFRKFPQSDQINLLKCGGGYHVKLFDISFVSEDNT